MSLELNPVGLDPLEITDRLYAALRKRQPDLIRRDNYYAGEHPLAFASERFRGEFGGLFDGWSDNWCDLVVDSVEERLNVTGFRFGGEDTGADKDAWRFWQANNLDLDAQLGHTEALVCSEASVLVWPGDELPEITVEHPTQVIVATMPGRRRQRTAALKAWRDDRTVLATLYLPDAVYKYEALVGSSAGDGLPVRPRWQPREITAEPWPLTNPLDAVPVVPLENRPRLIRPPSSEIDRVMPLQDAVNKLVADMLVASEFGAFRQRWASGIEIPVDPDTGQEVEPFRAAVDRIWLAEAPDARFGEFSQTDLGIYVRAIEMIVQHVASQTRTPPHYFALTGQFPSGESIKSAETGLVAKVRRRMTAFSEAWETVMRYAFLLSDDAAARSRAEIVEAETLWSDPESRSEGEHVDAVLKMSAAGVPTEALWELLNFSPPQIERYKALRAAEQLLGAQAQAVAFGAVEPGVPATVPATEAAE